jgi:DNA end-binding protein Ku
MAQTLLKRMEGDFDLSMFEDRYQTALQQLVDAKLKGKEPVISEKRERPTNVVNLFDALKASLDSDSAPAATKRTAPTKKPAKKKAAAGKTKAPAKARKRA